MKAVAETRGWRHRTHADLYRTVNRLAEGQADDELPRVFRSANALHQNFYEGDMPPEMVAGGLRDAERFVELLGSYLP